MSFAQHVDTTKPQALIARLCPYLLLLAISLPALTLRLATYPPIWFDEGYRTNAARTLAERGVYGTYTAGQYLPFDAGMSSGPIEIISIVLSFRLLGTGVAKARLINVLFTLLALFSLYGISIYLYRRTAGLFVTPVLLAFPPIQRVSFLLIGRQALSEAPALAMITLGLLLWFLSWEKAHWGWRMLAGLALGLGLLSKTQIGIALFPTLLLIAAMRGLGNRSRFIELLVPPIIMAATIGGWMLLGYLLTPEQVRQENSSMLFEAIGTNLLTGLFGRTLNRSSLFILAIMGLGVSGSMWRLWGPLSKEKRLVTNAQWAEATLAVFVLCSALWVAFLSVGWARYAYASLVVGLLLVGRLVWDVFQRVCRLRALSGLGLAMEQRTYPLAIAGLTVVALLTNVLPIWMSEPDNGAQQMADYIRTEVPRDAVIESWEWELDALSSHWEYHHPHQRYLFLAIRQRFHEQRAFDLDYDLLQANPDYLVTGPTSNWTHIYDPKAIKANFTECAEIGTYRIYRRSR
jgi:4-amino-4-deoxy-L-arabinose transferase-like glycosyltransferase